MDIKAGKDENLRRGSDMDIRAVNNEELLQASALRMAFSIVNPFLLKCALRLKIPDIIWRAGHGAPLSAKQIAAQLPSEDPDLDALSRFLTYLSTMGVVQAIKPAEDALRINAEAQTMKYTLTNLGKTYFISPDISPLSLAPLVLLQTHAALRPGWDNIHERVLQLGNNFQKSRGTGEDFWSYAAGNPEVHDVFNAAMVSLTKLDMSGILATYDGFQDVNTLVDVGEGHGELIAQIITVYPHIQAINYDLPHVIAIAPTLPGILILLF
jgi:caffeic acid 3-O-methyltransferase